MTISQLPRGWQIYHQDQLFIKATSHIPDVSLKFFHYPAYRQTIQVIQPPLDCTLKTKGNNTFFLCQKKVRTKDSISLERKINVFPIPFSVTLDQDWGKISDIPYILQQKYKQSSSYWPINSTRLHNVSKEEWFIVDELADWVKKASTYLTSRIKHPENQEKRLGADQAFLTRTGDCDEFTDLFITFARIRGIPCRRLTGYFISDEKTDAEPHAWGEILSPILGWIPIDIALHNIGNHTVQYVIVKIEEFNPALSDYQIINASRSVDYHWERHIPLFTPIY
jgi:hypothetical protein